MVRKRERTSQLPGISFLSLTFFHDNKGKQGNYRRWDFFLKKEGDSRQLPHVEQFWLKYNLKLEIISWKCLIQSNGEANHSKYDVTVTLVLQY